MMKNAREILAVVILCHGVAATVAIAQGREDVIPGDAVTDIVPDPGAPIWLGPQGTVLYDNGPLVTSTGNGCAAGDVSLLQTTSLGMNTLGFGHQVVNNNRVADDFTVPAGGWELSTATFFAYQTGSTTTSTMNAVNFRIWDGPPTDPGSNLVCGDGVTSCLTGTAFTGAYRATETAMTDCTRPIMAQTCDLAGCSLPAGTYWIDWQTGGTLGSGPWAPPISIIGTNTTGNGRQGLAGVWGAALDSGTGTPQQGFPFILEGQEPVDLAITKTGLQPSPGVVVYTLTVTNNGPGDATGVVVTDTLPAQLAYVSDDCGGSDVPPWTWNVGSLANGGSAQCNITLTVVTEGSVDNTASVAGDQNDPTPANDASTATLVVAGEQVPTIEIPTVGEMGLLALFAALAGCGLVLLRRRTA